MYWLLYALTTLVLVAPAMAEQTSSGLPRGWRTLGGKQYWTDQLILSGWRIQQHARTASHRLLTDRNRAVATGSFADCRRALQSALDAGELTAKLPTDVLVTLHGLGRTRSAMQGIGQLVSDELSWAHVNFEYASTRQDVQNHAAALRRVLDQLQQFHAQQNPDAPPLVFHFVAHSLGNIVVRHALFAAQKAPQPAWRQGRMVMLGPPNQGSSIANLLKRNPGFRLIAGRSGDQLGGSWAKLQQELATPSGQFGIIAGGKGNQRGFNPLLSGDDDMVVRVEETKLDGSSGFAIVNCLHTLLMNHAEARRLTVQFMRSGQFE